MPIKGPPHPFPVPIVLLLYLSQAVPQSFGHDAAVVITLFLIGMAQLIHPEAGNYKEAQEVTNTRMQRSNEVRQAVVWICTGRILLSLQVQGEGRGITSRNAAPSMVDSKSEESTE